MAIKTMFDNVKPGDLTDAIISALDLCKDVVEYDRIYRDAHRICSYRMHTIQANETAQTHESGKMQASNSLVELEAYDQRKRPALTKVWLSEYAKKVEKAQAETEERTLIAGRLAQKLVEASEAVFSCQDEVVLLTPLVETVCQSGKYIQPGPLHKGYKSLYGPVQGDQREMGQTLSNTLVNRASLGSDIKTIVGREPKKGG